MVPVPLRLRARDAIVAWVACAVPRVVLFLAQWPNVRLEASSLDFPGGQAASDLHTPLWPPAFEAIAELLWRAAGGHPFVYGLELIAVHALVGVAVLWIARALSLSVRASWIAVAGVALLPYYVATAVRQVDVGVIIALSALAVAVLARWWVSASERWLSAVGAAAAAFVWFLARAEAGVVIVMIFAWAWSREPVSRHRVARAAALFGLCLLGWSGMNAVRFGHFTPFPAHGGYHLWVANHPGAAEELWRRDFNPSLVVEPPGAADVATGDVYATDAAASRAAWSFVVAHPGEVLRALAPKVYRYWDPQLDDQTPHSTVQRVAYTVPYAIYLPLAVVGAVWLWRRREGWPLALLTSVIVGYWAPHVLLYGLIRHRMTVEWALVILAAVAVDALFLRAATAYSLRRDD